MLILILNLKLRILEYVNIRQHEFPTHVHGCILDLVCTSRIAVSVSFRSVLLTSDHTGRR